MTLRSERLAEEEDAADRREFVPLVGPGTPVTHAISHKLTIAWYMRLQGLGELEESFGNQFISTLIELG